MFEQMLASIKKRVLTSHWCPYEDAFCEDMRRCDDALGMGGLMGINAEMWIQLLANMPDDGVRRYFSEVYKPGLLNPFQGTSFEKT